MVQQAKEGHSVAMLWPGQMGFINKQVAIRKQKSEKLKEQNIQSFEIINPLPVSYDEGIADIATFTKNSGNKAYEQVLHSLMLLIL